MADWLTCMLPRSLLPEQGAPLLIDPEISLLYQQEGLDKSHILNEPAL